MGVSHHLGIRLSTHFRNFMLCRQKLSTPILSEKNLLLPNLIMRQRIHPKFVNELQNLSIKALKISFLSDNFAKLG